MFPPWFSAKAQINYIHIERLKVNMAAVIVVMEKSHCFTTFGPVDFQYT